jgi:hydrogenase-4 membrane subunit HyfE
MSLPLILCLIATLIPVFFGKLGAAPTWLSIQALALGWISLTQHSEWDVHTIAIGLEVLLLRAWLVPTLLRRACAAPATHNQDLMPSNLFAWGAAVSLIILAFKFGNGSHTDVRAMTLGVVAATTVMAFLVLATNALPAAQLVALLFMENALTLFETLMPRAWPLPVHVAVSALYVLTAAVGTWLVRDLHPATTTVPKENAA